MKTSKSRRGGINNPNLTYQAEPREVKLRKIISGESSSMEDGVFPTIYTEKKDGVLPAHIPITRKTTVMDRIHNGCKRNVRRVCCRNAFGVHVSEQGVGGEQKRWNHQCFNVY